jgi:cytochrome c oxidase subunit 2
MGCPLLLFASQDATENLSIFAPVSPSADFIRSLFFLVVAVCLSIFLIVEGVLIYSLLRFRRKPTDPSTEPPQVYGSTPIEIAWTTAPALIVFIFALAIFRTDGKIRVDPATPPEGAEPLYVSVVGHQWWWEYRYYDRFHRDFGQAEPLFITANELHVPASDEQTPRPVYLTLQSADVCHSFWLPRLAGKTDLIPARTNRMWFQTNDPGLYLGQCAEYCGTQHANMLLRVYVEKPVDFAKWLENEKRPAVAPADDETRKGRDLFLKTACVNCHRVRGTLADGTFGPDLTHLMSRQTLAAGMVKNTAAELRRWVDDPQAVKPVCLMPAMKLSAGDVDLVVRYLQSLR